MDRIDHSAVPAVQPTSAQPSPDAVSLERARLRADLTDALTGPAPYAEPSEDERDAQSYRHLRERIRATMTDPDRWDGDESEGCILAEYVEWLAAGQPDDDAEAER